MKKLFAVLVVAALICTSCKKDTAPGNGQLQNKVSRLIDSFVTNKLLPGVSVHISKPGSNFTLYAGLSDLEAKTQWKASLPSYAQSISKSFTATAVLQLAEKGKLQLDDPIKNYLDKNIYGKIENGTIITIRQLLQHTAGVFDYLENPAFVDDVFSGSIFPYDYAKSLSYVFNQPALFPPGTGFSYSNTNYTLLALVVDKAAGMPHGEYIKQNIINKLQLKHTFYTPSEPIAVPVVDAYLFNEDTKSFDNVSELQYALTKGMIGDDGLVTTPDDLGKFFKQLFETNRLLTDESRKEMLRFVLDNGVLKYGLGITYRGSSKLGDAWGHSGAGLGAGAEAIYIPGMKTMIVVMTNAGVVLEGPVAENFESLFQEVVVLATER